MARASVKVLVTGASGYVGSRLVPRLLADGHQVVAGFRDPDDKAHNFWWADQVEVAKLDLLDNDSVQRACTGVDALYYLVHSMDGDDFEQKEKLSVDNVVAAVNAHEVPRVIYLSGLVPTVERSELSAHVASRLAVEERLGESDAVVIALRAAVVLGAASTSFEIVRQVSQNLPIHTIPTWMRSAVQPIALVDALEALAGALTFDTTTRHYDVGGCEQMPYPDLLRAFNDAAGLTRPQVVVPAPEALVGPIAGRIIDVPAAVVEALMESLHHDMVCTDDDFIRDLLPAGYTMLNVAQAIERAMVANDAEVPDAERDPMTKMTFDPDWAS